LKAAARVVALLPSEIRILLLALSTVEALFPLTHRPKRFRQIIDQYSYVIIAAMGGR
jgi:hypothetical protein